MPREVRVVCCREVSGFCKVAEERFLLGCPGGFDVMYDVLRGWLIFVDEAD